MLLLVDSPLFSKQIFAVSDPETDASNRINRVNPPPPVDIIVLHLPAGTSFSSASLSPSRRMYTVARQSS